ncbi:MAG TPA: acyl-CoA thioesterase/bile acid-CoA:amino acid N-acyltransferase family protein [Steroidobacteraceae bacterium]|nr:acyl-CoA thioesterase/bile acid-CoA:amino acid N-acyltransferase family protein [Steroidobacteraceae bacterium]
MDTDHKRCAVARAGWVLLLLAGAAVAAEQPELSITPASGLIDAPFHVVVRHVLPGVRVRVSARRPDTHGRMWTAIGEYSADADGRVDVDTFPSLAGSYKGVSPHGLWCSALPVAPEKIPTYLAELPHDPGLGTAPTLDAHTVYQVELSASVNGKVVATATARRTYGHGIVPEEVSAAGRVRGLYFPPAAGQPRGVPVVVVAGSGGGLMDMQAALLASHGHPALAQGIFDYKDLPSTLVGIPLETFRAGARWLEQRTGVKRVAIMGTSRGSEAAGLAASYFPQDFAAAVVYVPSHLCNGAFGPGITSVVAAWTYQGKPLAADHGETDSNNADDAMHSQTPPGFIGTPYYLDTWSDPRISARLGIPFERMSGPVLAIGAGADQMWPSFIGAAQIGRRLAEHGKAELAEVHIYPGAGHMVSRVGSGGPFSSFVFHPVAKDFEATGGLPNANCEGSYDAWDHVLSFLGRVSFN